MASLPNLTDDEIRSYVSKFNLPSVPITDSTRKLLLRKIQTALDGGGSTPNNKKTGKKTPATSRSNLSNISITDNHNDKDVSTDMLPPPTLPAVTRRSNSRGRSSNDSPHPFKSKPNTSNLDQSMDSSLYSNPTKRQSRTLPVASPSYQNGFETGSDSDVPEKPAVNSSLSRRRTSPINRSFKSPIFPSVFSNLPTSVRPNDLSPPKSRPSTPSVSTGQDAFDFSRKPISSYSSRFSIGNNSHNNAASSITESDEEEYSPRLPKRFFPTSAPHTSAQPNNVGQFKKPSFTTSKILFGCFVLFFICLTFIYMNIQGNSANFFNNSDTKYPICGSGRIEPGVTCVMDDDIPVAIEFLPHIYDELYQRSVSKHCGYPSTEDKLIDADINKLLTEKNPTTTDWELRTHVPNIKVLIKSNPHWTLKVMDDSIVLSKVELPITCSISSFFAKLFFYSVQGAILLFGTLVAYKGIQFYLDRKEKSKREILKMVDDILHMIRAQAEKYPEEPFLPIRHIKDQLIPLYERDRLNSVWLGVVKMMENEARVRQEIQLVQGEDQDVWRWLPPQPVALRKHKTWQGAAFETEEGSVNALPVSPTACLKIRNMFDPREEDDGETSWVTAVEDALLEKCEGINILHIGVDRPSTEGIVFIKCASCADAGRAYRALHGAWFNSKLVTVKYLRYERYHERFPQAKALVAPLKPSNDRRYSLQQA
uniref:Inner nuclear membrane protein Man1 n=1 Tax=Cacopsylla melanoneura TaxID=428564 RepID=A0A8D9DNL2_9HEMI